jgi:autotransporter-associated beta strand protein
MLSPARLSHRLTAPARLGALLVLVATALLGTGQRASAQQSYVWNGSGSNDWNTLTNWTPNLPIAGFGTLDLAVFDSTGTNLTTTLGATNFSLGTVQILNPTGLVTIGATGGSLTLNAATGFDLSAATADLTVSAPVTAAFAGSQAWTVATGRTLTVSGPVTLGATSTGLTFSGNGTVTVSGATTLGATSTFTNTGTGLVTLGAINNGGFGAIFAGGGNFTTTGVMSGAGGLTVNGGTFTMANVAHTFTGNVAINGPTTIFAYTGQGNADPTNGFGAGSKTITLTNGGTLRPLTASDPNATNPKMFVIGTGGGTFDVPNSSSFILNDATQFSGTGNLTVTSTGTGAGVVTLGQASVGYTGFTGNVAVNSGTLRLLNTNAVGNTAGQTITVASGAVLDVGALNLPQNLTVSGTGISGAGALINGNAAAGSIAGTLTLAGATSLGGSGTGNLTLNGVVSGAFPVTKVGTNSLTLTNAGNTFAGAITVSAGLFGATSDGALGDPGNSIALNNASGTATLEAFGTFSTNRTVTFGNATSSNNLINVSQGNTLTLNSQLTGANGFQKGDPGTLILTNNTSTLTGAVVASGGILRITQSSALGATSGLSVSANSGTAFQLDGSGGAITFAQPITLNATTGVNSGGALENFAGTNVVSGAITLGGAASIGADPTTTLTITGGITGAQALTFAGAGNINLTTTALGAVSSVTKIGSGTTTLGVASTGYITPLTVNGGTFALSGPGAIGTAAVANTVTSGGRLFVDDSGTAVVNRLGGTRTMNLSSGTFEYTVNGAGASSESIGALTSTFGGNTIKVNTTGQTSTITFVSLAGNAVNGGSGLNFTTGGTNAAFGTAANKVVFTAAPTLTNGIIQRAYVTDSTGNVTFATHTANGIQSFTAYNNSGAYTDINAFNVGTTDTVRIGTGGIAGTGSVVSVAGGARTLNGVLLDGSGFTLNGAAPSTLLTLSAGSVLVNGGSNTIGSNLVIAPAAAGNEIGIGVAAGSTLNLNGTFANAFNVTKNLGGNLVINARQFSNTGNNYFTINGGTVTLNAGNNTLFPTVNQNVAVGPGGTLDLNGTSQLIGNLTSPNNNAVTGSGGIVTNSSGTLSTLVANHGNATFVTFGGQITGNVFFAKGGGAQTLTLSNDNTYTGGTLLMAQTTLTDGGRLSGTTALNISNAQLTLNNTGTLNLFDRVNDAAPITLRSGAILFSGRAQTASTETLGAVTLALGNSNLNVTAGGTGVNSAELTIASITQGNIDATVNIQGANGQAGSNPRLFIGTPPTLTNNILPVWIESSGNDFSSYTAATGVIALGAAGAPAYTGTTLPAASNAAGNYKIGANGVVPTGGLSINTLVFNGAFNVTFGTTTSTDVLTLNAGGLMKSNTTTGNSIIGSVVDEGRLTSGAPTVGGVSPLYVMDSVSGASLTINSRIVDNGATPVRLVINNYNGGTVALANPNNSYTGGTSVNGWINGSTGGLSLTGAGVVIPAGGLSINNSQVTTTAAGQINPLNVVTMTGNSNLSLTGANTLAGLVLNNTGGTANPVVATGGVLTLGTGATITATSNNPATASTINGTLDFAGNSLTIAVDAVTVNGVAIAPLNSGLTITAVVQNGGITKTGTGNLQLSGASTFAGGVNLTAGGLILGASSTPTLGTVASGPLGTGTLTAGAGTTLLSTTAVTIANPLAIQGNLNFAGTNSLTFNGAIALPASPFTINVDAPQQTASLLGSITTNPTTAITKTGFGTLALGPTYAGTVTMPIGGQLTVLNDGDGRGTPQALAAFPIVSSGVTSLTVGRQGTAFAPYFATASNKTIQFPSISTGGAALIVTNNNGYGVELLGSTALTNDQYYTVANATNSNVVPGLTLTGQVTGGFGIVKQGAGTLVLGNATNTFGGASSAVDIRGGVVAVASDGALGAATNQVILNANAATGVGLRATGTFSTNRSIVLNQPNNAIEVTGGNTLTVTAPFVLGAVGNGLAKNDAGTLALTVANPTWTGPVTINQGAILVSDSGALGSGAVTVGNALGAALQLTGGVTVSNALNYSITGGAVSSGLNYGGGLESVSGVNTATGLITQASGSALLLAADSGATLNINGGVTMTGNNTFYMAGAGTVNLNSTLTSTGGVIKFGTGTASITTANTGVTGVLTVQGGTLALSGAGQVGITGAVTVNSGSTLLLDNSGTNLANRLNNRSVTLNVGTLNFTGNAAGSTDASTGGLTIGQGGGSTVVLNQTSGGAVSLTFNTLTFGADSSAVFSGANLGTTNNKLLFTTAPTLTNNILPRAITATGGGFDFVTYGATNGIAAFTGYATPTDINAAAATDTVSVTAATTTQSLTASKTINALKITGAQNVGGAALNTLTLSSGGVAVTGGGTATISVPVLAFAGNQALFHVDAGTTLNLTGALSGSAGFVKADPGTLVLTPPADALGLANVPASVGLGGTYNINGGTLQLGANNAIPANSFLRVAPGGTLDLSTRAQYVQALFNDPITSGAGLSVEGAGGTVTGGAGSLLVANYDNTARQFSGTITGQVSFVRSGQNTQVFYGNNDYTGTTILNGGTTTLRDGGRLSGTTAIDINYANLTLDNNLANPTGTKDLADRVNNAAPITMRGGTLLLNGRIQSATAETLGAMTFAEGLNSVYAAAGGTGINSAVLTLGSIGRPAGSAGVVNFGNPSGAVTENGQIGSTARVVVTTAPALTNNMIGPWAIVSREWASYIPTLGVGQLNATGFAGYATNTLTGTPLPTDNIRLNTTGTTTLGASNVTINTLAINVATASVNTTLDLNTRTLTLAGGGLILAQSSDTTTIAVNNGTLTSGFANGSANDLYAYFLPYAGTNRQAVIGAVIADNGATPVRLIATTSEGATAAQRLTLNAANTYTGGTVVNGGTLAVGATGTLPAGGITLYSGGLAQVAGGVINSANTVTLNGPSVLSLVNDNTLAGLIFNNTGGASAPTVNTFTAGQGAIGTGTLTIGASGITASSSNVGSTAIVVGRLNFGATANTISVDPILVNGVDLAPLQAALALQGVTGSAGGITKAGAGSLQLNVQDTFTGPLNVTAGGLMIGGGGATGLAASNQAGSRYSALTLASGTRFDMNNFDATFGSLAGSGVVINATLNGTPTARTLNLGFDNTSTTFSGSFARFTDAFLNPFQVNKIGAGTMTLTGVSTTTNNLQVSQGGVTFGGAGTGVFGTYLVLPTGTLTLDNSGTNVNGRLGATATTGTLTVSGEFKIIGNAAAATTETVGTLNIGTTANNIYGSGTITLVPNAAQPLTLTVGTTFGGIPVGTSGLIRGVSATAGNGLANLNLGAVALGAPAGSGTGANGTTTMAIRPDLLGDASATGTGTGFITKDSATNFLRPLTAAELAPTFASGTTNTTVNFGLASGVAVYAPTNTVGSLTLLSGGGVSNSALSAAQADGLPVTLTVNTGGILAFAGNTGISTGRLTTNNNLAFHFHTEADLAVSAVLFGTTNGLNKGEAGTLTLNNRNLYTGQTQVNAGTLKLNGGDNTLPLFLTAGAPTTTQLGVNTPTAVVDLNGTNQINGTFGNNLSSRYAGAGGTLTNSSATPVVYTTISGSAQVFGGQITGNLAFTKTGNNALTFSNVNTYTGATTIRANTLTLVDAGALPNTSAVNVFNAGLNIDQSGLNPAGNLNPTRIPAATPVELRGGSLTLTAGGSMDSSQTLNTVSATQGHSTISVTTTVPGGSTNSLTIGNLVVNPDATVNLVGGTSGFFATLPGYGNSNLYITSINGVPIPANITGKILPANIITNNGEFATYVQPGTTGSGGLNWGVSTMNNGATIPSTGATIPQAQYDLTSITAAGTATQNVRITTSQTLVAGGTTFNSLALRAGTLTVTFTNPTDVLNLASGGLALTNGTAVVGSAVGNGVLTAGGTATGVQRLYIHSTGATINAAIADNGSGGQTRLVGNSISGALNIAGNNSYTGGTVFNASGLNGAAGGTVTLSSTNSAVPDGGLTINNAAVTQTVSGNISASNDVVLNGGASLTLTGANILHSLTFNNYGGTATPTVAVGATALQLTTNSIQGNAITSVNDNPATVPTISGTQLILPANTTVSASGLAPLSLVISAPISGPINLTKTGNGTLDLSGANTFAGTFNLNAGTLSLGNNAALGTATLVMANGTALVSDTAVRTITNNLTLSGNVTFGSLGGANNASTVAANGVIVNGNVDLGAGAVRTINVNSFLNTATIGGVVSGTGSAITKTGPGTLVLTGANTYDSGTRINGGTLQTNATGIGSTGTVTFGGGVLQYAATTTTDFSARFSTANNQPFYIDTNGNTVTYATALSSPTGGSVGKFGAGSLILQAAPTYDGVTVVNAGTLQFGTGATSTGTLPATYGAVLDGGTFQINRLAADTVNTGSITGNGNITIDQGTLRPTGAVTLGGNLTFGSVAGATPVTTVGTLDLTNATSPMTFAGNLVAQTDTQANTSLVNQIIIPTGKTLTFGGNGTVGFAIGTATQTAVTKLTASGGGALVFNNPAAVINVGVAATVPLNTSTANTLDVTALSAANFGTVAAPITTFNVAFGQGAGGTVLLSNTANTIAATTVNVGNSNGANGGNGVLTLGTGTNQLNADTFNIGFSNVNGTVAFASQTAGSPGTVAIANKAGTGAAAINIGSNTATATAAVLTGTLDLRGHTATVNAGTVTLGNANSGGTGAAYGVLRFDTGTFTATTLNLGLRSGATSTDNSSASLVEVGGGTFTVTGTTTLSQNSMTALTTGLTSNLNVTGGAVTLGTVVAGVKTGAGTGSATGNINVSGGSLTVVPGSTFTLASQATAGTASGTLNITGGTATINADIVNGGGTTTATLILDGGTLDVTGKTIGGTTAAQNLTALTFASGTLKNVAEINTGADLVKVLGTGTGILNMTGVSTYTGRTQVTAGTLTFDSVGNVGAASSSLGAPATAAAGTIGLGSGTNAATLQYVGAAATTTDRVVDLAGTTGAVTLSNTGAGAITLTSNLTASGAGAKTLTLDGTNTGANTIAGVIPNNSAVNTTSLTKAGAGTWVLTGANTYTGPTTVSAGTLALSGSGSFAASPTVTVGTAAGSTATLQVTGLTGGANFSAGAFTLAAGQTLAGHGTVNATGVGLRVPAGTTVAPGTGASGTLAVTGSGVLGGTYAFDLTTAGTGAATPGANGFSSPALPHGNHDVLTFTGTADVTGLTVTLNSIGAAGATGFDNTQYYSWKVLQATGGLTGTPVLGTITGTDFSNPGTGHFFLGTDSNALYVNFTPVPVPEPATVLALAAAGLWVGRVIRRRRTATAG